MVKRRAIMAEEGKVEVGKITGKSVVPSTKPIEVKRENTAMWLSIATVTIFGLTILATLGALLWVHPSRLPGLLEFIKVILPAETALLGMSFGFYFSQSRLKGKSD
jgi:hypothetical protein